MYNIFVIFSFSNIFLILILIPKTSFQCVVVMLSIMPFLMRFGCKVCFTFRTNIGSNSSMNQRVNFQIMFLAKRLETLLTVVRLFSTVHDHVSSEICF